MKLYFVQSNEDDLFLKHLVEALGIACELVVYKNTKINDKDALKSKTLKGELPVIETKNLVYLNTYFSIIQVLIESIPQLKFDQNNYLSENAFQLSEIFAEINHKLNNINREKPTLELELDELRRSFNPINEILKFNTFLTGNRLSWIDFILYFVLERYERITKTHLTFQLFPHIIREKIFIKESVLN